jgi:hypothetical protein
MTEVNYSNTTIFFIILWGVLGYFVYGGLDGALAMLILATLMGLTIFIALIPFAGVFIQAWFGWNILIPWVMNLTHLTTSWLTTIIFAVDIAMGVIIWIIMTLAFLAWWK